MAVITETTKRSQSVSDVRPSVNSSAELPSYSPDQDFSAFGKWVSKPIFVPPQDSSVELARYLLNHFGPWASKEKCWKKLVKEYRSKFTQVREIELPKASIRLPKGRLFVTVTEQQNFDTIEDPVPDCVRTRLDEFLEGPGKKRGVKVYYLKPLCVEVQDQLILTTQDELNAAVAQIQAEVFAEYRRLYPGHLAKKLAMGVVDAGLLIPRTVIKYFLKQKKREIDAYHCKLEFERRQRALRATQTHRELRTDGCTYDEMLSLIDPPAREAVIDHYVQEKNLSAMDRKAFLIASAATLPWFATLSLASLAIFQIASATLAATVSVAVCDPAFVAEMPGSNGVLLKIGHFDEVDGVMHIEI
jgi:hypothetical protein